nr:MAG TPA: hypothetical protein [Caudoviricetes sp.]DAY39302.1 MAG TPA: hypothetical protein [Caudoviricetes sp.]
MKSSFCFLAMIDFPFYYTIPNIRTISRGESK